MKISFIAIGVVIFILFIILISGYSSSKDDVNSMNGRLDSYLKNTNAVSNSAFNEVKKDVSNLTPAVS